MAVNVSKELVAKLEQVGDKPILDSEFIPLRDGSGSAEKVLGTKGWYVSSPVDGWALRGPFGEGE